VFQPVPQGKQLIITQASCIIANPSKNVGEVQLGGQRPNGSFLARRQFLKPSGSAVVVTVNDPTLFLYAEKDRPLIGISLVTASTFQAACTIAGQIIDTGP
jgi:hypothetical protein